MSFLSVRLTGTRDVLGGQRGLRCLFRERLVNIRLTSFSHRQRGSPKSLTTFSSTHDYVVCGAGSAGCVLANRLSADPNNNVLLLEAGPNDRWALTIQMPAALGLIMSSPKYNWCYNTIPQKNLNNRTIFCPRGRALGGTSSINGMVYIRGHAYDYDRWESEGAKGWSYADCLPYFRKAQTHKLGADEYRGGDGPLHVTKGKLNNPLFHAFIKAGQEAGYPYTEDMNGYQQEGVGSFDMTVYKGKRWNTPNAYLKPVQWERKKRLRTETQAFVTKILFEGNKAIGIEYQKNNQVRRARANKEVILSGGAINSPQLLMLSGIGDGNELKKHGIPVVCHLPGVGQNLQDHMLIIIQQACTKPVTLWSKMSHAKRVAMIGLMWLITRKGLGTTSHLEAGGFIRSKEGVPHPNIQFHFIPLGIRDYGRVLAEQHVYQVHVGTLRSQSKGFVKLKSANPRDHPIIDFNYMSTEEDWEEMRAGVRFTREIFQQKAFHEFRGEELTPGKKVQTDDEIDDFIRQYAETAYHPSCTCKMGDSSDKLAVVDNEARVFGVERLRVVDASIMPSIVSGNTNAPTIMIAEKAADHILGNEVLPKSNAPVFKTPEKGQR